MTKLRDLLDAATPRPWKLKGDKSIDAVQSFPLCPSHYHIANLLSPGPVPRGHAWQREARSNAVAIVAVMNAADDLVAIAEAVLIAGGIDGLAAGGCGVPEPYYTRFAEAVCNLHGLVGDSVTDEGDQP